MLKIPSHGLVVMYTFFWITFLWLQATSRSAPVFASGQHWVFFQGCWAKAAGNFLK